MGRMDDTRGVHASLHVRFGGTNGFRFAEFRVTTALRSDGAPHQPWVVIRRNAPKVNPPVMPGLLWHPARPPRERPR